MKNSIPVARLSTVLVAQLDAIKSQSQGIYEATIGVGQRPWQLPASLGDTLDDDFDRTDLNKRYTAALMGMGDPEYVADDRSTPRAPPGEGRVADVMVSRAQSDYLSVMERAERAATVSPIRARMHAASRRLAQSPLADRPAESGEAGSVVGGVFTSFVRWVGLLLESGYNVGPLEIAPVDAAFVVDADSGDVSIAGTAADGTGLSAAT